MQIVIDKESLVRMLKVSLYAITGADYKDIGETVNELLDKVGYVELPKGHGDLIDRNDLLKHYDSTTYHNGIEERKIHFVQVGYVNDAQAIIEADKESEG